MASVETFFSVRVSSRFLNADKPSSCGMFGYNPTTSIVQLKELQKNQLKELHVILACDETHKKVFPELPIIGFKNNKNLKSHLVRAVLPDINEVGRCEPCGGKRPSC